MASSTGSALNEPIASRRQSRLSAQLHGYAEPPKASKVAPYQEWPDRDKEILLHSIRKHGFYNLDEICKELPYRNRENIKNVINQLWKYGRACMQHVPSNKKNDKSAKNTPAVPQGGNVPIDQWLREIENMSKGSDILLAKSLAQAFLYISRYEPHPPPEDCNGVDFKALYEYLYCMLNGFPSKNLNPKTASFVLTSLNKFSASIKARGVEKELHFLERNSKYNSATVRQYGGKKKTKEVPVCSNSPDAIIKKLGMLQEMNPLNVNVEVLRK